MPQPGHNKLIPTGDPLRDKSTDTSISVAYSPPVSNGTRLEELADLGR